MKGNMVILVVGFCVVSACGGTQSGDADLVVEGSRSDVATEAGTYDGYDVIGTCEGIDAAYSVVGTGSNWYNGTAPDNGGRYFAMIQFGAELVAPALANIDSFHSHGVGGSCQDTSATHVFLQNWTDVDQTIEQLGTMVREQDLSETILIFMMATPTTF